MTVLPLVLDGGMARVEPITGPKRRQRWSEKWVIAAASFFAGWGRLRGGSPGRNFAWLDLSLAPGTPGHVGKLWPGADCAEREPGLNRREGSEHWRPGDRGRVCRQGPGADTGYDPSRIGHGARHSAVAAMIPGRAAFGCGWRSAGQTCAKA